MIMKVHLLVYAFLIHHCCLAHSNKNGKEFTYSYQSIVELFNKLQEDIISQWTVSGKLIIQDFQSHRVFKLEDVKTSLYNGLRNNIGQSSEKDIEEDALLISEPFGVFTTDNNNVNISVLPDEALWSVNMKRAIASIFVIDPKILDNIEDTERTIHGDCFINYEITKKENVKMIKKNVNMYNCNSTSDKEFNNAEVASTRKNFRSATYDCYREYTISKEDQLISIESSLNISMLLSPDTKSSHHFKQIQRFVLVSTNEIVKPFDISNNIQVDLIFEEPEDRVPEGKKTQTEIMKDYKENFKNFMMEMNKTPLTNFDVNSTFVITEMYKALAEMDSSTLITMTLSSITEPEEGFMHVLISILPYIGTKHTTLFIKNLVKNDAINDLLLMKMLATFPLYMNSFDETLLKNCAVLLNLRKVSNPQLRNIAVLSFASLLQVAKDQEGISDEVVEKYGSIIYQRYIDADNHEDEITYLLALINLGTLIETETIINNILNPVENRHVRSLSIYGFKHRLISLSDEIYPKFWPLVQNKSEDFEVRIAALDLLLSSEISQDQFYEIVNTYSEKVEDPYDKHIANYIFSTINSVQNTTGFYYHLGDLATERLRQGNIPHYADSWTTGNYRIAFTDENENFGVSLQTKLIADPMSKTINVIQMTFNHFATSLNMGQYSLYLKLEGVLDLVFIKAFLNDRENFELPIQALLELIQNNAYKFREIDNIHIEIVLFSYNTAVFGLYINEDNIENYMENALFTDLIKLLVYYNSISFPIWDSTTISTDLGTKMNLVIENTQAVLHDLVDAQNLFNDEEVKNFTIKHRVNTYAEINMDSYNPLANSYTSVKKIHSDIKHLELPLMVNISNMKISWENSNDSFNWIMENMIGTFVYDETNIKNFCSECEDFYMLPMLETKQEDIPLDQLGVIFNFTFTENIQDVSLPEQISFIINTHQSNSFAFPAAKPVLYYLHWIYYHRFLANDLTQYQLRSKPLFKYHYKTELQVLVDENTIYNDNDPIDGEKLNATFEFVNRAIDGDFIITSINGSFNMESIVKSTNQQKKSHVEHVFTLLVNSYYSGIKKTYCLNRQLVFPNRQSDKYLLNQVKPAKGKITYAYDYVDKFTENCPPYFIKLTEVEEASEARYKRISESKDVKTCKKESKNLKYTPPTKSCIAAHKAVSLYDTYAVYIEFLHGGEQPSVEATDINQLKNNKILEYFQTDDGHINVTISQKILAMLELKLKAELTQYQEISSFADFMTGDPTSIAYDDYDTDIGLASECIITANSIKTFVGDYKDLLVKNSKDEIVAFIECFNSTRSGLTVQKYNENKLGFKFWSGENIIATEFNNNAVKFKVNDEELSQTDKELDNIKIHFLEEDVLLITDNIVSIYYTTESITLKGLSIYNNYLCGKCHY